MQNFKNTKLITIIKTLKQRVKQMAPKEILSFEVLNPDLVTSHYSGSLVFIDNKKYIYHGYKIWIDLAQQLNCRMLTPIIQSKNSVLIKYELLNSDDSFHKTINEKEEKYGEKSIFSQIHKNEESAFLYYYLQALENVQINRRKRVLNLGVNSGDEFEIIKNIADNFEDLELIGIDYCASAIDTAKEKFASSKNIHFFEHDINHLNTLELGKFDLIITIGTLQSSNLKFNKLLMSIVQNQLKKDGAMILGFPNCRWIDGEMIYGARVKNYAFSELSLLYKDVIFAKKYLQQKKYRVTVTGKDYIFLTATSIR